MSGPARIHTLLRDASDGAAIEARSLATIDAECPPHQLPDDAYCVVRRMIHSTADFKLLSAVRFSADAIEAAVGALRAGRPIYVDANMIRAGLSMPRLRAACPSYEAAHIVCRVADPQVAAEARAHGLPRSLFAVRAARDTLDGGIAVFGNAPVGLLELCRLVIEEGVRPAVVLGMPVGFVHVLESKEELVSLPVPHIVVAGRRGGSPLALSALHALCGLAADASTRPSRPHTGHHPSQSPE
jgi:precorrin isomerase